MFRLWRCLQGGSKSIDVERDENVGLKWRRRWRRLEKKEEEGGSGACPCLQAPILMLCPWPGRFETNKNRSLF